MTRRYYANAAPQLTLSAPITNSATSLTASSFAGWPATFPFFAVLEIGSANMEIVSVTNVVGTTATIVRAQDGTSAVSHNAGATLDQAFIRQDLDEANAHVNATSGAHGVAGTIVGTSDTQTLTNKTLTSPTINTPTVTSPTVSTPTVTGGSTSNGTHSGDATHPALVGQATTAGGKTLSLRNSSSAEQLGVDDAGNVTTNGTVSASGTVTGGAVTTAGAVTGGSLTTSGNASAGKYIGPVARGFIGESASGSSMTLPTLSAIAAPSFGYVTFTLTETRRIRIMVQARVNASTSAFGHYIVQAAYTAGSSPNAGTCTLLGQGFEVEIPSSQIALGCGATEGSALLVAGTYTAHFIAERFSGGAAGDTAGNSYVAVYDAGNA